MQTILSAPPVPAALRNASSSVRSGTSEPVGVAARQSLSTAPESTAQANGDWLQTWCAMTDMVDRLNAINTLARNRLPSDQAAAAWLHLMHKASATITPPQMESLVRQYLVLAPESQKAAILFEQLMNTQTARNDDAGIIFMITSCVRYLPQARRVKRELEGRGARCVMVIGDPALHAAVEDGDVVKLPVPDTYEALTSKVLEGLAYIRRKHGAVSVAKIDDDMRFTDDFDPAALDKSARVYQYVGQPIGDKVCDRTWHLGKCATATPVFAKRQRGWFGYGPMYVLGPRAVEHLVREWVFYPGEFAGHIYEDRAIGDTLRTGGIELQPVSIARLGGITDPSPRYLAS